MKENPYFKRSEFECKCGKCKMPDNVPSDELIDLLVDIREHYGNPVTINSGYRCPEHNAKVGGSKSSMHVLGSAADIVVAKIPTEEVFNYVMQKFGNRPLGIAIKRNKTNPYAGFVHLDTRGKKARWEYR